ncbi:MAG: L,D-transpeptidase family protein [Lachnospiraceae bacterium]|nr:L,D-transpeptidase family protein [Lachnospiraceae bacterium]
MKTNRLRAVLITVISGVLATLAAVYIFLAAYYAKGYSLGTYINGIYCTGKTPTEVNALLQGEPVRGELIVQISEEEQEMLDLSGVSRQMDYMPQLEQLLAGQNPFLWCRNLLGFGHYQLEPEVLFDEEALNDGILALSCMSEEGVQPSHDLNIRHTERGYVLEDHTKHIFDRERAFEVIRDAAIHGRNSVDLVQKGCYYDLALTPDMEELYAVWEKIDAFQSFSMKYLFGDSEEIVDASVTSKWIMLDESMNFVTDENGLLVLNEQAVADYVTSLAQKYDTYGLERRYETYTGKTVTVNGGIYGNQLDQEAECAYLVQAFYEHNTADREPEYVQKALYQGSDDVGPDYIEINLTEQTLYYIKGGELFLKTDIVSGSIRSGHRTPSRICYVQGKYRNTVLRGPDYASFVYYWVPVYQAIGIHDATWRNRFGEEIYLTNGSHGCVNVPLEQMKILYADIETGLPVILFYEDEEKASE